MTVETRVDGADDAVAVQHRRYDVRQRGLIRRITRRHRDEWLEAWSGFFGGR